MHLVLFQTAGLFRLKDWSSVAFASPRRSFLALPTPLREYTEDLAILSQSDEIRRSGQVRLFDHGWSHQSQDSKNFLVQDRVNDKSFVPKPTGEWSSIVLLFHGDYLAPGG